MWARIVNLLLEPQSRPVQSWLVVATGGAIIVAARSSTLTNYASVTLESAMQAAARVPRPCSATDLPEASIEFLELPQFALSCMPSVIDRCRIASANPCCRSQGRLGA